MDNFTIYVDPMLGIDQLHHVAIICSDYPASRKFYTELLGLQVIRENYRVDTGSYKLDLQLGDRYVIELFSFPDPPQRLSHPEACGLRHLAFEVADLEKSIGSLLNKGVVAEPIRVDPFTGKRYTFFQDPDQLPIELYEK